MATDAVYAGVSLHASSNRGIYIEHESQMAFDMSQLCYQGENNAHDGKDLS